MDVHQHKNNPLWIFETLKFEFSTSKHGMSFKCLYCRETFNHIGTRNLHQCRCKPAVSKRSYKPDDMADIDEPVPKLRKYSAEVGEDWVVDEWSVVVDEFVDESSVVNDEWSVVNDQIYVRACDQTLLKYQKMVENMFRDGLGIIHNEAFSTKVKKTSGEYDFGNRTIFLALVTYCSERHKLSSHDCDELIDTIKFIIREHGDEIPLPSRYVLLVLLLVLLLVATTPTSINSCYDGHHHTCFAFLISVFCISNFGVLHL